MIPLRLIDLLMIPYLFLFIGLINVGSEFQVELVDSNVGPAEFIVTKKETMAQHCSIYLCLQALLRHLLLLLSRVPFKCLSRQSFECRDIHAVLDVVCSVVRLLRHSSLTLLLDNCHDKLIIVTTNFLCLIPCLL